ncbi:MAG TPA: helix-turn-helix domain-containing protein [Candidatus Baltobacteraceae bacterium]|nr:helix-turn-helix domain-containing protein [Candidatus Baltobacteraceae bacterium]
MQAGLKRADLKQHIARVAARLFCEQGIHAVGVDRIADEAQITKRTLYHHFSSKNQLIAESLRVSPIVFFPDEGPAVERMIGAFEMLACFLEETDFRSCPYIFYTAELVDARHPARAIIERRIAKRLTWFRDRALEAGAARPDRLAEQLDILFDGALAAGAKRGNTQPARAALDAARTLIALSLQPSTVAARSSRATR